MSLALPQSLRTGARERRGALPLLAFAMTLGLGLPFLALTIRALGGSLATLSYLAGSILPDIALNSALLALIVAVLAGMIGVVTAALVSFCHFPFVRQLEWLLLLPLAMPAYIIGYAYADFLSFSGPVQSGLRATFALGRGDYWFPNVHSLPGVGLMLALVLYPYVYLTVRGAFLEQSAEPFDAARLLGCKPVEAFFSVAMPMARPAIMAGAALVIMEAMADFATVQYFGVNTFTTAIYRAWFGMGDRAAAAQLALMLVFAVIAMVVLEKYMRRRQHYAASARRIRSFQPVRLRGLRAVAAFVLTSLPVLFGFVVPVLILARMHVVAGDMEAIARFGPYALNSLLLAAAAAIIITSMALVLAEAQRLTPSLLGAGLIRFASLGYAIPGTVVAVGVLMALGAIDASLDSAMRALFGASAGLFLSGSAIALVYAYGVRFSAVALGPMESGFSRIAAGVDYAARTLGASRGALMAQIHLPLMRRSCLIAMLGVFVDTMKELPATLIVRPFNFDTLAVRVYNLASDERLAQASTGALAIVLVGVIPVLILARLIGRR